MQHKKHSSVCKSEIKSRKRRIHQPNNINTRIARPHTVYSPYPSLSQGIFPSRKPSLHPTFADASCKALVSGLERKETKEGENIPVFGHIEELRADEKSHIIDTDSNQYLVPGAVKRLVVVTIDLKDKSMSKLQPQARTQKLDANSHWTRSHC